MNSPGMAAQLVSLSHELPATKTFPRLTPARDAFGFVSHVSQFVIQNSVADPGWIQPTISKSPKSEMASSRL